MTERQSEALRAIQGFTDEHGYPPSYRQLGGLIGLSSSGSVAYIVQTLKEMGKLDNEPYSPRTLTVPEKPAYVPELVIDWEAVLGDNGLEHSRWSVVDDNEEKQPYASFRTRKEAEAYRQGWFDGFGE